jgi:LuxR family transcriptional regulator, maltose regulon positive regulatory protein
MAEVPAAAPPGAAASGPDVLLATKLHVPRPQPGFVPRPRLTIALDRALARRFILVCAPAGFGKTSELAHWASSRHDGLAWLSLDTADNDPARFWRHALAAMDRVRPGIADHAGPLLDASAASSSEPLVTALINELAAQPGDREVALVLDDYHLIVAAPVHASLIFLLEHMPPGLRLVLATRSDPPLPLARLRARGQLAELRGSDLRFTADEAASLLGEATGAGLPAETVAALTARTEGWAAGLQLAALSLRGQGDPAGFVTAFSGSHRYVLDYLASEVLEQQSEQVRAFLLETSVLDRMSGELCDAVTGRADGAVMLEATERAGLFVIPLDEVRGWWRYHHLFADLLRARLQQERPDQVPALHRAAAAWHEAHGLADDAIRHALAAGDTTWAARLIERHTDALLFRGERDTVQRWLSALPAGLAGSRPRLLLAQVRLALLSGRAQDAEHLLDAAERAQAGTGAGELSSELYEPSSGREASVLANVPASIALDRAYLAELRGDGDRAAALATQALAATATDERMLASHARGYLGLAEWLRGRLGEAEKTLTLTVELWETMGERNLVSRGCHHLGQVQRAQGRLQAATGTYQHALEVTAPPGRAALPAAGAAHVGLAEVAYQRNELEAARRHVTEGIALSRHLAYAQPLATGLATLAWIRQAMGDAPGAREAIGEAWRVMPGPATTGLLNPVPVQRARLLLAQGDVTAAARWTRQHGLDAEDEADYAREPAYLVLARLLLAQDRPAPALALLERLLSAAADQGRTGSMIEIRALQALALAASGEQADAVDALARALVLGSPEGYVRVFADEGTPMAELLTRLIAAQRAGHARAREVPLDGLARVLRAFGGTDAARGRDRNAGAAAPGLTALVEPLSPREIQVLRLLAAGATNQAIARELVVTLDTVKKHVGHILAKLGAANRTEAVARARQLGLIS